MPCNGNNHSWSCDCGWGGTWHGNAPTGSATFKAEPAPSRPASCLRSRLDSRHLDSFTIPNARCPVCGISVFFYQNSRGSRVFFDDLGPPWPKHPCTDTAAWRSNRQAVHAPSKPPRVRADWIDRWRPFSILGGQDRNLTVHDALLGTRRVITLDRAYEGHDLPIAHVRVGKSGRLEVVLLGSRFGTPETYVGRWRRGRRSTLTGFRLYCEREREVIRRIDERRQVKKAVDEIKRNRFSNVRGRSG